MARCCYLARLCHWCKCLFRSCSPYYASTFSVSFLGERHQNIFMVSWTCRRALLNWPTLRSGGVFRLRGALRFRSKAGQPRAFSARCRRGVFLKGLPWQDVATVHSRAAIRGKFCVPCIPKVASGGKSAPSRQDSHAMYPKTGSLWQDMRAMHPKSPANSRLGIHRAKILPRRGRFRCTDPSNHARRADLAIPRCSV